MGFWVMLIPNVRLILSIAPKQFRADVLDSPHRALHDQAVFGGEKFRLFQEHLEGGQRTLNIVRHLRSNMRQFLLEAGVLGADSKLLSQAVGFDSLLGDDSENCEQKKREQQTPGFKEIESVPNPERERRIEERKGDGDICAVRTSIAAPRLRGTLRMLG
jgi:hypothetical protein